MPNRFFATIGSESAGIFKFSMLIVLLYKEVDKELESLQMGNNSGNVRTV